MKYVTNLVPNESLDVRGQEVELVNSYVYLGQKLGITRDNQTCKLKNITFLGCLCKAE